MESEEEFEGFHEYERKFVAVTGKEFEESDEHGKIVAVNGGVVAKVTVPFTKFKN